MYEHGKRVAQGDVDDADAMEVERLAEDYSDDEEAAAEVQQRRVRRGRCTILAVLLAWPPHAADPECVLQEDRKRRAAAKRLQAQLDPAAVAKHFLLPKDELIRCAAESLFFTLAAVLACRTAC